MPGRRRSPGALSPAITPRRRRRLLLPGRRPGPAPDPGLHRTRWQGLARRHGYEVLLAFALSLLLSLPDPFGHAGALDRYGRDLFNQLFGPAYGTGARNRLLVVLLQDSDLAEGLHWPAPYAYHAGVLAELRALRPAAVMVDFLFVDEHRPDATLDDLAAEMTAYRAEGIPLFFAGPPPGPALPGPLARLAESGARLVPVPRLTGDGTDHAYPLFDCAATGAPGPCTPTAAAAVYRQLCAGPAPAGWPCDPALRDALGRARPAAADAVMEVFWSTVPADDPDGHPVCGGPPAWLAERFWAILRRGDALRLECAALPTLAPTRLLHATDADAPVLATLVRDRVVFYGADLLGGADVIRPSSHDRLAGVYFHAMALDNLLTFGRDFKRRVGRLGLTPDAVQGAVTFVLDVPVLLVFLVGHGWLSARWRPDEPRTMALSLAFKVAYWVVATALVLAIAWYAEFRALNLIPGNWLEGALAAIVGKHLGVNVAPFVRRLIGGPGEPDAARAAS